MKLSEVIRKGTTGYIAGYGWWEKNEDTGIMRQWGTKNGNATSHTITFPLPFLSTTGMNISITGRDSSADTGGWGSVSGVTGLPTTSGFVITTPSGLEYHYWEAIGYYK